jgi:diguanylate cyclase
VDENHTLTDALPHWPYAREMQGETEGAEKAMKSGWKARLHKFVFPDLPMEIADSFQSSQMVRVLRHMPMIYAIATLNMAIVIALCIAKGLPFSFYGWMFGVAIFAFVRMWVWIRRSRQPLDDMDSQSLLIGMTLIAIGGMGVLSLWTSINFVLGHLDDVVVIPVSLVFGATCVAHCIAPLRIAASGTLIAGIVPTAVVMIGVGDFQTKLLGICMLTIAAMMLRFVSEQYDHLVKSLVLESQIRTQAYTDALTGLPNRRAMIDALQSACARQRVFAVALLDLDGFKAVNDSYGHHVGDLLIQHVGQRLEAARTTGDLVGRLGGDEFIVLMHNVREESDVAARASSLLMELCRPALLPSGHQIPVEASLGFAICPEDGEETEALLIAADRALYAEKRVRQSVSTAKRVKAA